MEEINGFVIVPRGKADIKSAVGFQGPGNPKLLYIDAESAKQALQVTPEMQHAFQALPIVIQGQAAPE